MENVVVNPAKIRVLGSSDQSNFCVITNESIRDKIKIIEEGGYSSYQKIIFYPGESFDSLLLTGRIPEKAHILVISPDAFFRSPPEELVGPHRKLLAMACNSTPTDLAAIQHFIHVIEDTDPQAQQEMANRFFSIAEKSEYLDFVDEINQTRARFHHNHKDYLWNEQAGVLGYGEQQLAPAGEISVLPIQILEFNDDLRLDFNGTIAFHGYPILHAAGTSNTFLRADQERLHHILDDMQENPIIAEVEKGIITHLHPKSEGGKKACDLLENIFDIDSRYRILWEIGFGVNTSNRILAGNHAMNETFGNKTGAIHFGIGLTSYTQYHLDIVCPNIQVLTDKGEYLINAAGTKLNRQKSASCGCAVV